MLLPKEDKAASFATDQVIPENAIPFPENLVASYFPKEDPVHIDEEPEHCRWSPWKGAERAQ